MARLVLAALLAFSAVVQAMPKPVVLNERAISSIAVAVATSSAPPAISSAPVASASSTTDTCVVDSSLPGSQSVGTGAGAQFITGQCFSKDDCASGCCVAQSDGVALCKPAVVTAEEGLSCDFSCSATVAVRDAPANTTAPSTNSTSSGTAVSAVAGSTNTTSPATAATCAIDYSLPGSQSVGPAAGAQFITGQCFSKADCASACCVAQADGVALCKSLIVTGEDGLSCDYSCTS
ncbi:hypothetical protein CMQ_7238 [Grosmannia clavigera kw1407]|uniref:Biotrophy-associated secreted protein 2 n=1 Tax=Grosmannia clavigera (strain kw1407 / UAMH 11150) TaxID=655863 RepID=F0XP53_GROCL|nr:uncharacterized protein CMQ_7238 [Grosmannia clavigera kw1407]EFX00236.1 hypothetical protein CMQ_7238 [Grosmannia clavigera kw1407]